MGAGVVFIKSIVADYCKKSNRHQQKLYLRRFFYFAQGTEGKNQKN